MSIPLKAAYICEPQVGGTFSFFQAVRMELKARGIDFFCVPPVALSMIQASRFRDTDGVDAIELPEDPARATAALVAHLLAQRYDLALTLPSSGVIAANLAPYLPPSIRCVMRVPMMSRGAYAPTQSVSSSLDHIVGVSRRVADDLHESYGIRRENISIIYNGVDLSLYPPRTSYAIRGPRPTVLFTGRLSDVDKGVHLLPKFLAVLKQRVPDAELWVAGEGPDRDELTASLARHKVFDSVRMLGAVSHEKIHELYYQADCYVLPSRLEGCPNSLMEAMAAGTPCAAAAIKGSVSEIVTENESGLLFDVADAVKAADRVASLLASEPLRRKVGAGARRRIEEKFSAPHTAGLYAEVMREVVARPSIRKAERPVREYRIPKEMQPTWRTRVPVPLKNFARKWLEKFGRSA